MMQLIILLNKYLKEIYWDYLFDIKILYLFLKVHPVDAQLTMFHYKLLFPLDDDKEIDYYINNNRNKLYYDYKINIYFLWKFLKIKLFSKKVQ